MGKFRAMNNKGDIVEVEILDAADKAQTFARLPDGMPLFVQGPAAVGDTVRAQIFKKKSAHCVARLLEVLKFSDRRTEPVCSYFGICGGCKWQHYQYDEQLRIKTKMVADNLHHIGQFKDFPVLPSIGAPEV
jgi:23S rRNA (uracil1939-C5)-methyltransferase